MNIFLTATHVVRPFGFNAMTTTWPNTHRSTHQLILSPKPKVLPGDCGTIRWNHRSNKPTPRRYTILCQFMYAYSQHLNGFYFTSQWRRLGCLRYQREKFPRYTHDMAIHLTFHAHHFRMEDKINMICPSLLIGQCGSGADHEAVPEVHCLNPTSTNHIVRHKIKCCLIWCMP